MEQQLNRIELKGNVGSIKVSGTSAGKVAHFSLATNYVYNNRNNEAVVETTWHNIVAWEGKGIKHLDRISKGDKVYVCGRLRLSKFTGNDGTEKQVYEIVANRIVVEEKETGD